MQYSWINSTPVGRLLVAGTDEGLKYLVFEHPKSRLRHQIPRSGWIQDDTVFVAVRQQLDEYFTGRRTQFDLPLAADGTEFQKQVWAALRTIPNGETRTYGQIATQIGNSSAARAVGMANGLNPISIVVPCHRVVGSNGKLTGFGGGIERKRFLLELEAGRVEDSTGE
ncbi:MAG: methylated-DNA--[protein]-cysteine S-methyltransferase [Fuerstiella sp.]